MGDLDLNFMSYGDYIAIYDEGIKFPTINNSVYYTPDAYKPRQIVFVIAPSEAAFRLFLSKANKSESEYHLVPIIDNDMTLAQIFLTHRNVPVIFLEGYTKHPAWDFIKNFIDLEKECIKP